MFSCALACRRVFDAEIMQFSLRTISCFFLFVLIHHLCPFSKFVILNRDLFRPVDILILDATTPTIVGPKNVKSCWIVLANGWNNPPIMLGLAVHYLFHNQNSSVNIVTRVIDVQGDHV